jgi:hypothetical protein
MQHPWTLTISNSAGDIPVSIQLPDLLFVVLDQKELEDILEAEIADLIRNRINHRQVSGFYSQFVSNKQKEAING